MIHCPVLFFHRYGDYPPPRYESHPKNCSVMTFRGHQVLQTLIRCHFSPAETTGSQYIYSGSYDGRVHVCDQVAVQGIKSLTSSSRFGLSMVASYKFSIAQTPCRSTSILPHPSTSPRRVNQSVFACATSVGTLASRSYTAQPSRVVGWAVPWPGMNGRGSRRRLVRSRIGLRRVGRRLRNAL